MTEKFKPLNNSDFHGFLNWRPKIHQIQILLPFDLFSEFDLFGKSSYRPAYMINTLTLISLLSISPVCVATCNIFLHMNSQMIK